MNTYVKHPCISLRSVATDRDRCTVDQKSSRHRPVLVSAHSPRSSTTWCSSAMSAVQQKDVLAAIDVPQDVFEQLLANISVAAASNCGRNATAMDEELPEAVRATQNTAVLAGESPMGGLLDNAAEGDSDSSEEDDNSAADPHSGKDGSWPLAKWQHQVNIPQGATAMGVNRSSSSKAALASQKAFSSKLARAPLQDARKAEKASRKVQEDTAGKGWFDMKAQPITDSVKRDWRLLRLRATYDPRRFYKNFDSGKIPKYFQMGTIVEGMGEFYSARMTKKERKQTLTEELLADINLKQQRKRRFEALQAERQELARQRKKIRALHKRSKHRPKH